MADRLTSAKRSELMSRVKNKDTNIELILRKRLWSLGFRYRVNYKLFGKPDIIFPKYKLAIFCDGDFWHGRNFKLEKISYKQFWKTKISKNMERDKIVNITLSGKGWVVLRFWKKEITKNTDGCIKEIKSHILYNSP